MAIRANSALAQARSAARHQPRVGLTELARTSEWRARMVEYAVVEICDHNETAGYLVSPEGMDELLYTIEELERELELAQIAAIVEERGSATDWKSGEALVEEALAMLQDNEAARKKARVS